MLAVLISLAVLAAQAAASPPTSVAEAAVPTTSTAVRRALAQAVERDDRAAVTRGTIALLEMGAAVTPETLQHLLDRLDPSALPSGWPPAEGERRIRARFAVNASRSLGASRALAQVPAEHRLIEGIAWDSARNRLFVGSILDRRLLVRQGRAWRRVPTRAPLGGVFGMAIDSPRRRLWVANSGADPMPDSDSAFSGLVAIDLDRLREVRRIALPGARLGDVAVAADGTLFASDSRSGAIYRCPPGCVRLAVLVPGGLLRSPQGLVVWPDGRRLYVADYSAGLFRIDLDRPGFDAARDLNPLSACRPQMLEGIDGLLLYRGDLLAIQNGTRPMRIVRISLDPDGRRVTGVAPVEQNAGDWTEPTLGTIVGGELAYVDGHWPRYGEGGNPAARGRATALRITTMLENPVMTRPPPEAPRPRC